jgi:hypothetical protein
MDPNLRNTETFRKAVQEVMDNSSETLTREAAEQKVFGYIGLDLMADSSISVEEALRRRGFDRKG